VDNFTLLGSYTISGFSRGTWYTLALRANGSAISVEVNGSTVIGPVTDTAFTSGDAGLWLYLKQKHRAALSLGVFVLLEV
jgi:hypothetical protein